MGPKPVRIGEKQLEIVYRQGEVMSGSLAIVMAAGKGTRMESDLPKVLVPACGRPMIEYVLDTLEAAGVTKSVVVVGYRIAILPRANPSTGLLIPQLRHSSGCGRSCPKV